MSTDITQELLDLTATATSSGSIEHLHTVLLRGHQLYCAGLAATETSVLEQCADLDGAELAAWCARAQAPWTPGVSRQDAITDLVFATWDSTPAAMAYAALASQAEQRDVWLVR